MLIEKVWFYKNIWWSQILIFHEIWQTAELQSWKIIKSNKAHFLHQLELFLSSSFWFTDVFFCDWSVMFDLGLSIDSTHTEPSWLGSAWARLGLSMSSLLHSTWAQPSAWEGRFRGLLLRAASKWNATCEDSQSANCPRCSQVAVWSAELARDSKG